jgi:hypothetical protein
MIAGSAEHRGFATVDTVLKDFAEAATYQIQLQPSPAFTRCPTITGTATSSSEISYAGSPINYEPPAGFSVTVSSVSYLANNTSFTSPTCDSVQNWPELITVSASGPNGASGNLSFVVADPLKETYVQPFPTTIPPTTTTTIPPTTTTTVVATTTTTTPSVSMHVGAMTGNTDGAKNGWDAVVTIKVVDASGNALAGVSVAGSWASAKSTFTSSCTTNASGTCQVLDGSSDQLGAGTKSETYTVSGLTLSGDTYNPAANTPSPPSLSVGQP